MENLWFGDVQPFECQIHPTVPLEILQHYSRKHQDINNVFGVLLGNLSENKYQARSIICTQHNLKDEKVSINKENLWKHIQTFSQALPSYKVLGIYTTYPKNSVNNIQFIAHLSKIEGKRFSLIMVCLSFEEQNIDFSSYRVTSPGVRSLALLQPIHTKVLKEPLGIFTKKKYSVQECLLQLQNHLQQLASRGQQPEQSLKKKLSQLYLILQSLDDAESLNLQAIKECLTGLQGNIQDFEEVVSTL